MKKNEENRRRGGKGVREFMGRVDPFKLNGIKRIRRSREPQEKGSKLIL